MLAFSCNKTSLSDWHQRLGHPAFPILKQIISHNKLDFSKSNNFSCNACLSNKSHKLSFSQSTITSSAPLEIIYSDVWTSPVTSINNFKYYLIFVDHFTRYLWFYPLRQKSEVKTIFIRFKAIVEKHFEMPIKKLYSDNGGEYIALADFLSTNGISHFTFPTPTLNNVSPYEKIFLSSPNYSKLKIFVCLYYPWLRPYTRNKLESNSKPCVFLGYSLTQSAFYCLDPTTSKIYTSRHVRFIENHFPLMIYMLPLLLSR